MSYTKTNLSVSYKAKYRFFSKCGKSIYKQSYESHTVALYRILSYLKITPSKSFFFQRSTKRTIKMFTNADWASSAIDWKSTFVYYPFVWGNLVT